mmetsp:Transcript_35908/g.113582  ORF Transcript_35908/g.113582 Transcript_35908/m.113582 type:complete len:285 (-) Transcript_35908:208-1062(-)
MVLTLWTNSAISMLQLVEARRCLTTYFPTYCDWKNAPTDSTGTMRSAIPIEGTSTIPMTVNPTATMEKFHHPRIMFLKKFSTRCCTSPPTPSTRSASSWSSNHHSGLSMMVSERMCRRCTVRYVPARSRRRDFEKSRMAMRADRTAMAITVASSTTAEAPSVLVVVRSSMNRESMSRNATIVAVWNTVIVKIPTRTLLSMKQRRHASTNPMRTSSQSNRCFSYTGMPMGTAELSPPVSISILSCMSAITRFALQAACTFRTASSSVMGGRGFFISSSISSLLWP